MEMEKYRTTLSEIFLNLSEVFKYPTNYFYHSCQQGVFQEQMEKLGSQISLPTEFSNFPYGDINDMRKDYVNMFLGPHEPYAPPVESYYKVWTTDPTAEVDIANKKGYFFGDSANHMVYLFQEYGLEVPEQYRLMPDHLSLLLEFLSFLYEEASMEVVETIIEDHFDWLDDFKERMEGMEGSSFFLTYTEFLIHTLDSISTPAH